MIVDFDVKLMKPDSVLYRDKNGKIICVPKEEFLKEHNSKIAEILNEFENLKNNTLNFQKSITSEILRQNERIEAMQQAQNDKNNQYEQRIKKIEDNFLKLAQIVKEK